MKLCFISLVLLFAPASYCQAKTNRPPDSSRQCKGVVHGVLFRLDGKPWGGINLILDPPGNYGYMLPGAKSNDDGEFRFENVCTGKWGIFVQDEKAGCPYCNRFLNKFWYGSIPIDLEMTDANPDVRQDVHALPKPGRLFVRVVNGATHLPLQHSDLEFRVNRKREADEACDASTLFTCDGSNFELPFDMDIRVRIRSKGFQEWKADGKRGKVIRLASGETQSITVELVPIPR